MITNQRINETYSYVRGSADELRHVYQELSVQNANAGFDPLVQMGYKDPCTHFAEYTDQPNVLKVFNGHLSKIGLTYDASSDYTIEDLQTYLSSVLPKLPFKPYDFQLRCFIKCILDVRKIAICCTGSGKSLIIALILDFFRTRNKKSILIVPNINLLTQFVSDIESYNLTELAGDLEIMGDGKKSTFTKCVTISTWQSFSNVLTLPNVACCIADECHRIAGEISSSCIGSLVDTKYRFGFTGTMPEDDVAYHRVTGLFDSPERFIRAKDLIDRGLGTPIRIKSVIFNYFGEIQEELRSLPQWNQKLKCLKEFRPRNMFVVKLATALKNKEHNVLVLFSHTQHGKDIYRQIMESLFSDVVIRERDITGKSSFEFQSRYNVYFINGEDDAKTREDTRQILETKSGCILVANYALLSTGVNIRQLNDLIFASPLKAYTTITQSIGRGIRKCPGKDVFTVYDLVDNLGIRCPTGIFYRQYQHRLKTSYEPEGYSIDTVQINLQALDNCQD